MPSIGPRLDCKETAPGWSFQAKAVTTRPYDEDARKLCHGERLVFNVHCFWRPRASLDGKVTALTCEIGAAQSLLVYLTFNDRSSKYICLSENILLPPRVSSSVS